MDIVTTCINCLPASANASITIMFATTLLAIACYRSA
jgi:hypothetical protein